MPDVERPAWEPGHQQTSIPFGHNRTAPLFAVTEPGHPFRVKLIDTNGAPILTVELAPDNDAGAAYTVELSGGTVVVPAEPPSRELLEADRFRDQLHNPGVHPNP